MHRRRGKRGLRCLYGSAGRFLEHRHQRFYRNYLRDSPSPEEDPGRDPQQFYRTGAEQVVAGYIMYGTSTVLVYSIGHGVYGFTLDHDLGEFLLSHENLRCPARGSIYSANVSHYDEWDTNIRYFVDDLTRPKAAGRGPYSLRYSGALVADFHRCLLEGGLILLSARSRTQEREAAVALRVLASRLHRGTSRWRREFRGEAHPGHPGRLHPPARSAGHRKCGGCRLVRQVHSRRAGMSGPFDAPHRSLKQRAPHLGSGKACLWNLGG